MINVKIRKSRFMPDDYSAFLTFPFNQDVIDSIKKLRNRSWIKGTKEWEIRLQDLSYMFKEFPNMDFDISGRYVELNPEINFSIEDYKFKTDCYKHQIEGFKYGLMHNRWLLGDDQGCIAGDCKVQIKEYSKPATRRIKLKYLYNDFKKDNSILVKSLVNGRFVYMPIKNVLYKGVKPTIKITLENTSIECTSDHLIYTDKGWIEAGKLVIGNNIFTNGQQVCPNCGNSDDIITKGGKFQGYCRKCMYKLRKGKYHKEFLERVREPGENSYVVLYGISLRNHPLYKYHNGNGIYEHHMVWYKNTGHIVDTKHGEQIHHINGIKYDNRFENLQLVTASEHAKLHIDIKTKHLYQFNENLEYIERNGTRIQLVPKLQKVINIEDSIEQDVYDIVIDDAEIHNFFCNNIVVHNCGKTKQVIDIAVARKIAFGYSHCLIVCGVNGLKWNWYNEVLKHSDEQPYILGQRMRKRTGEIYIGSTKDKLYDLEHLDEIDNYFIITNIETLRDDDITDLIIKWIHSDTDCKINMIAADEIAKMKNPSSQQGKAFIKLDADCRIAMTGTPLMNSPLDLYVILRWLGYEKHAFYSFKQYYAVFGGYGGYEIVGYKHLDELEEQLQSIMLRRLKKNVLDLPEKTYIDEYVDMLPKQSIIYKEIKADIKSNIDMISVSPNPLAEMIRLRQATGYTGILSSEIQCSAKLDRMEELIADARENGQQVIVFSNWSQITNEVCNRLHGKYTYVSITGDTKDSDRQKNIDAFQDGRAEIVVGTIGACGTGITLHKAEVVIFLDHPWNRANYEQAVDRAHRIGQTKNVTIYNLLCKNTIDERIWELVKRKGELSDQIVDKAGKVMTNKDIAEYLLS